MSPLLAITRPASSCLVTGPESPPASAYSGKDADIPAELTMRINVRGVEAISSAEPIGTRSSTCRRAISPQALTR